MHAPLVTLACAGLLGLIFVVLSARVVMARRTGRPLPHPADLATAEPVKLQVAIRSHANFAEYVPLCLILIGGLELQVGSTVLVKALAAVLVLARAAHPIGMVMPGANPFRAGGFVGTLLVLMAAGVAELIATLK